MSHSTNNKTSGFFSSLKENYTQKFANVTITSEKDGHTEHDTLIHNAFVKYFDQKHEPYPDWLGVSQRSNGTNGNTPYGSTTPKNQNMYSQFQPVQSTNRYNNSYTQQQSQQSQQQQQQQQQQLQQTTPQQPSSPDDRPFYGRKSSLQALHDKSRQQVVPGSGYTSQGTPSQNSPGRPNGHSTTGSRLREKMFTNQARYER